MKPTRTKPLENLCQNKTRRKISINRPHGHEARRIRGISQQRRFDNRIFQTTNQKSN